MFEAYGFNEGIIEDGTGNYEGTGIHKTLKYEFISTDTDYSTFDLNLKNIIESVRKVMVRQSLVILHLLN